MTPLLRQKNLMISKGMIILSRFYNESIVNKSQQSHRPFDIKKGFNPTHNGTEKQISTFKQCHDITLTYTPAETENFTHILSNSNWIATRLG